MKSFIVFSAILIASSSAFAIDSRKCSKMLNEGMWKRYKYGGMGEYNMNVMTQGTKKQGSSTVTSDVSTESSTALLDPKYYSNVSTSQTQSTSSWGDCSAFAHAEQLKKDREVYIAQNEHEVMIDVARGAGEHLKVITFYSACAPEAYPELSSKLQRSLAGEKTIPNTNTICQAIDDIISNNTILKSRCLVLN